MGSNPTHTSQAMTDKDRYVWGYVVVALVLLVLLWLYQG